MLLYLCEVLYIGWGIDTQSIPYKYIKHKYMLSDLINVRTL